jgi:hypothetical protein
MCARAHVACAFVALHLKSFHDIDTTKASGVCEERAHIWAVLSGLAKPAGCHDGMMQGWQGSRESGIKHPKSSGFAGRKGFVLLAACDCGAVQAWHIVVCISCWCQCAWQHDADACEPHLDRHTEYGFLFACLLALAAGLLSVS